MKVQEYQWPQRSHQIHRRVAEKMARKIRADDKMVNLKFDVKFIVNDAEMYLRMGYLPDEVELMICSDGASVVYRLYPKSAKNLKGRKRA